MAEETRDNAEATDQAILFPEYELTLDGRKVTVREFGFLEGIRIAPRVAPIVDGMEAAARDKTAGLSLMHTLMAEHTDLMVELMATACDQEESFVAGLSSSDGNDLLMAFWATNQRFFIRQLALRTLGKTTDAAPAGETSSQPSSGTATTGSSSDDATPSAS